MAKKEIIKDELLTVRVAEHPVEVVKDTTLEAVDSAVGKARDLVDSLEDGVEDVYEDVSDVAQNNPGTLIGVAICALSLGAFAGYRLGVRLTTKRYEVILTEQLEAAKEYYEQQIDRHKKTGDFSTPASAVAALHPDESEVVVPGEVNEALGQYQGLQPPHQPAATIVKIQETSIHEGVRPGPRQGPAALTNQGWVWNQDEEEVIRAARKNDEPYVISEMEFNDGPDDRVHDQERLTYYAADDTLVDSRDQIVDDTEYRISEDSLMRFGHGTMNQNLVHVRNDRIGVDYEIAFSPNSYAQDVLGEIPEHTLQHSARQHRETRRQRRDR